MIAFKGFAEDLTAVCGRGTYQYEIGKTYVEKSSKTARSGFHCAENPLDCFNYYPPGGKNRYCRVIAGGSIDETDNCSNIACTEMTIAEEIDVRTMVFYAVKYMIQHPRREWKNSWAYENDGECIARGAVVVRGEEPKAKGAQGGVIGLIVEKNGIILAAKVLVVGKKGVKPNTIYTLTPKGELVAV